MVTVIDLKKVFLTFLIVILYSCSNDSEELSNNPPSDFEIEVSEINATSATLTWTESKDPEESVVFYDVYLGNEKLVDNSTELTFNLENLEEGVVYSGKIIASDPVGNLTTQEFSFETLINQPPTSFIVYVKSTDPFNSKIEWSKSIDPEGGDIVYSIYLEDKLMVEKSNSLDYYLSNLKGLTIYSGYVEAMDPTGKVFKVRFMFETNLKLYNTDLRLENQAEVEAFGDLGYNKIDGNLILGSTNNNLTDVSDLSSLNNIQFVNGDIYIQNTMCKNLVGLENIKETTTYCMLTIDNNDELLDLTGLEGITSLHEIYIAGNKKLLNFNGLNNLERVSKYLNFPYNESLNSISGLESLTYINDLSIGNNDALINLKGLENVKRLRRLAISGNDNLQTLEGLNNLESSLRFVIEENASLQNLEGVTRFNTVNTLYISGNSKMRNLKGLESLTKVSQSISVQLNDSLESLEGINNVVFSGGNSYSLGISRNGKIENLDALSNFTFVKGSVSVTSNPELINFCGLTKLINDVNFEGMNTNTIFRYNMFDPSYQDMLNGKCSQ